MPTPANCDIVCYTDDALVIVGGRNMKEVINRANIMINAITRKINWMGLQVAAGKTEAVRFRKKGEKRTKENGVETIENTKIMLRYNIKYLGLAIRDDWSIRDHLEKITLKVEIPINKLARLMISPDGPPP